MSDRSPSEITRLLAAVADGNDEAKGDLWPLVYAELRRLARSQMAREKPGQTLQPTALVHEAYLRLTGGGEVAWDSRGHFFSAAAEAMRRILIDRARKRQAVKHGGGKRRVTLEDLDVASEPLPDELLALDDALSRLEEQDRERAQVVKLRFFAGLTEKETAQAMGISQRSAGRLWAGARAWLYKEMAGS